MEPMLREELTHLPEENTLAQLALRFIYSSIPVDSVEIAARSLSKLRELVEAAEKPLLSRKDVEKLVELYRRGRIQAA